MVSRCAVIAVLIGWLAGSSLAQEGPGGFEFPQPTEQHKELVKDAGEWNATVKMWMAPGGEPQVSKATETTTTVGGFWTVQEFKGSMMGTPFTGRGQYGYDPVKEKYVGTWIDSLSPHLMTIEGEKNEEGELVMIGTAIDSMTKQEMKAKMVSRSNDDGTRSFKMYAPVGDDEWFQVMQIDYAKK